MADAFTGAGGSASGGGSATVGGSQVISPLAIPELLTLFNRIQQQTPSRESMPGLQSLIQGGMQSPLLEAVLAPALQRLQAPQAQQRQNLTEATRAAGGLRGSTYGQDMNKLVANQGLQQNDLMGQVIQQVLGQLLQSQLQEQRNQFLPAEALTNLMNASRPQVGRGGASSGGWENISPSLGLATPMAGDSSGFGGSGLAEMLRGRTGGGSASVGVNAPAGGGGGMAGGVSAPYTPYLDPLGGGGGSNITFNPVSGRYESAPASNLGTFTPEQGGPLYPEAMPAWNPVSGAYQAGGVDNTEKPWWVD